MSTSILEDFYPLSCPAKRDDLVYSFPLGGRSGRGWKMLKEFIEILKV
jgi:hypothetical protein